MGLVYGRRTGLAAVLHGCKRDKDQGECSFCLPVVSTRSDCRVGCADLRSTNRKSAR